MKKTLNHRTTFLHTAIEVRITDGRKIEHVDLLDDIREIKLSDTRGRVHKYFKNDLIEGRDRFLVYIFEVGENFYKFGVIIRTDNIYEFINHAGMLTRYVVDEDIEDQTILTIV